ncbi:hypothetical protein F4808DRAFT_279528 [Astrocystis sublimbata]|nr:hypothetical protein F4808DRAFT_279528 [Astrocystis sublimbata]
MAIITSTLFWAIFTLITVSLSMSSPTPYQTSQLFQFTYPTGIRNLISLPNGCLLLSTSVNTDVWYIDPEALYPAAQNVATLPGNNALNSFAALGDGLYAVTSGASPPSSPDPMQMHVIKVQTEGNVRVTLVDTLAVPDTRSMEGSAALPRHPRTVLIADAIQGRILRVNTETHNVGVAFEHAALNPNHEGSAAAQGVKGLKIVDNYLYFTNSAQRTFGRFPINENGDNTGDAEILARLEDTPESVSYGDFSFDGAGVAFVAVHPSSVRKITPKGAQSFFAGGDESTFLEPTSVVVSNDNKSIYVSTAGKDTGFPVTGGQVLKVQAAKA